MKNILETFKNILSKALTTLADCIVPVLPIMIGVGMLRVVLIILGPQVTNIVSETSNTYIVLSFVADAGFYFMPIFSAISAAEIFKTNKYIAALIGAMLLSPTFVEIVNANQAISVFGLPIALTSYGNQVLSSIIGIFVMSYIYNFLDTKINVNIRPIFAPLITITIMIPIVFCAIGPLGVFLGNKLVSFIMLLTKIGPIGNAIMCALIPYICITGLAGANLSAILILAATGCDPILFFANIMYNTILGFVTLAIYLKDHKPDTLAAAITSTVAGTSEPALYGVVLKDSKALLSITIADFCAGLFAGVMGVKTYAVASFGIFGIVTTIGPNSSIIHASIAIVIGCIIGFSLSYILHTNKKDSI